MDRIKKFNELFDDENLKLSHEIDYISGKLNKFKIDIDFKNENMDKFVAKLAIHYPMFLAFDDANKQKNGVLNLGKAKIFCVQDEEIDKKTWFLIAGSETHSAVFGIRIKGVNNYDLLLYFNTEETENETEFEYHGISYNRVIEIIKKFYIPFLKKAGFTELLNYESDLDKQIKN